MDLAAALDRLDGDQELFLTLAGLFVERSPQALSAIQAAMTAGDLQALMKEAHKLKGSAMEFCAMPTVTSAAQLEESARNAARQDLAALAEQVHRETGRLTETLVTIIEKGFPT